MKRYLLALMTLAALPANAEELFSVSQAQFNRAAALVQERFPTMRDAGRSQTPTFIDSHRRTGGTRHGELEGYGVTMVANDGLNILFADQAPMNGFPARPSELFYEMRRGGPRNWPIIGMGYAMEFEPGDRAFLTIGGERHNFLLHEAGYHRLGDGGFDCAVNRNLRRAALNRGLFVDEAGRRNIRREDMRVRVGTIRHGRLWTIHVWFDPLDGTPVIAETDPWERQNNNALPVPECAFRDP